jgi:L-rhamnose mutarotase
MPTFLDVHHVPFKKEQLEELVDSPMDEFGVTHVNLFYNKEANVCFCLLDAPDEEAVVRHHNKVAIHCEWITRVNMARTSHTNTNTSTSI